MSKSFPGNNTDKRSKLQERKIHTKWRVYVNFGWRRFHYIFYIYDEMKYEMEIGSEYDEKGGVWGEGEGGGR